MVGQAGHGEGLYIACLLRSTGTVLYVCNISLPQIVQESSYPVFTERPRFMEIQNKQGVFFFHVFFSRFDCFE